MEPADTQQHSEMVHQQDWGAVHDSSAALAHLPLAQPLDQPAGAMPNLMPAITALIMQITSHLSQPNGNPQLALTFQPLVNMALNMQLQAWQQASATAHPLPVAVMEQMHLAMAAPPQAAGAITIESNVTPVAAQHAPEPAAVGHLPEAALPAATPAEQAPAQQQMEAQQVAQEQQAPRMQAVSNGMDTTAGIPPTYRETYESEGTDGEDIEDDDDDDYTAKGERGTRRGRGHNNPHRPQRARKRNKLLDEYLTDDEEREGGGHQNKQRRAHLE